MKKISRYLLDSKCLTFQTVYLPKSAEIVSISNSDTGLFLIVLSDSVYTETELHTFKICLLDENICAENISYIGNFKEYSTTMYVIEILNKEIKL